MGSEYMIVNEDTVMPRGDIPIFRFTNIMMSNSERIHVELEINSGIQQGYVIIPFNVELVGFINRKPDKEAQDA